MGQAQRTLPSPRHEEEWAVKRALRMLAAFKDVPGFAPLKKILFRPFISNSRESAASIRRLIQVRRGNPTMPRECYELYTFETLLLHMTPEEKASHVALLLHVFKALMTRHQRIQQFGNATHIPSLCSCSDNEQTIVWASNFAKLYVEVLQVVDEEGTSGELMRFVEYLRRTLAVELDILLLYGIMDHMNPNAVDYILACFSNERFNARGIRESYFLMHQLWKHEETLSVVLIRHGFKYSFDLAYYEFYCRALVERVFKEQPINIDDAVMDSGELRMQMAVAILVCLHFEGVWGSMRKFHCMLWQSLPDPFITPDELYHLMEPFSVPGSPVMKDLCARYRELFPGVPREKQPRSLKHLARVRIRESMVRAHSIGERAVRSLGLPKKLEDYLWKLEEF